MLKIPAAVLRVHEKSLIIIVEEDASLLPEGFDAFHMRAQRRDEGIHLCFEGFDAMLHVDLQAEMDLRISKEFRFAIAFTSGLKLKAQHPLIIWPSLSGPQAGVAPG